MRSNILAAGIVVGAIAVGAWYGRDSAVVRDAAHAVGLGHDATPSTGQALRAAGVHKCQTAAGVVYSDQPCPKGSRELAANGGAVTVMNFPKAAPAPASAASGLLGGPLMKGFSQEEIDRLREKQIDAAANR